jgi:hypothetical protein
MAQEIMSGEALGGSGDWDQSQSVGFCGRDDMGGNNVLSNAGGTGSSTNSQESPLNMTLGSDPRTWNIEEVEAYFALKLKRKSCAVSGCTPLSVPIAKSYHK